MLEQFPSSQKEASTVTPQRNSLEDLSPQDRIDFNEVGALLEAPNSEAFDKTLARQDFRRKVKKLLVYGMTMLAPLLAKANTTENPTADFEAPQTSTFIPVFKACGGCPNSILNEVAKVSV